MLVWVRSSISLKSVPGEMLSVLGTNSGLLAMVFSAI